MKKRNLALYISGGVAILIALATLIIVYAITGDLITWFQSKWGGTFIILGIVYILIWGIIFIWERIRKL